MKQKLHPKEKQLVTNLKHRFYAKHITPREEFLAEVKKRIDKTSVVLDYGAGRGRNDVANFKADAAEVHATDIDEAVLSNPYVHEARLIKDNKIPYSDNFFDVVYCLYVLEHIENPLLVFSEIHRVLKPGGYFMALTPSAMHYISLVARLTPHSFHEFAVEKTTGRKGGDTFPTYYRANTEWEIKKLANEVNLAVGKILMKENWPIRLSFHPITYLMGVGYERLVTAFHPLRHFRGNIIVVLHKPVE